MVILLYIYDKYKWHFYKYIFGCWSSRWHKCPDDLELKANQDDALKQRRDSTKNLSLALYLCLKTCLNHILTYSQRFIKEQNRGHWLTYGGKLYKRLFSSLLKLKITHVPMTLHFLFRGCWLQGRGARISVRKTRPPSSRPSVPYTDDCQDCL